MKQVVCYCYFSVTKSCPTLCDPMDCSPLSMGFPRQEYWSGLPFPSPVDFPNPGTKPESLALYHWITKFAIQFSSVTQSCPSFWDPMNCSMPGVPVHHQLPELTQTHVHRVGDEHPSHPLSHPLSSPSPPAPNPSQHQGLFQWVNASHEMAKYWSFSCSISPSNEHPGLVSFRMDWLDLLVVQGTLKSLLQHHSSKASILRHSASFTFQLSHPYMTTGKTVALTRRTFVGKVMSLLLNMLSRLVITFLPRSKCLLISWLISPSAVILEPK